MSQLFDASGNVTPVTFVEAGPIVVTAVRTKEKDGYEAVQVGFGTRKAKNISSAQKGQWKELGNFQYVREFRPTKKETLPATGEKLDVSVFKEGESVAVSGITKSKGFQGVVKRHGFRGGPSSHGVKHAHREPGSIGGGLRTRVPKGMRMAGRMGGERVTIEGLKIIKVDQAENILALKGAIPGIPGALLEIRGF